MSQLKRIGVMMGLDRALKRHSVVFAGIHDFARQKPDWRLVIDEWADHTLPARAGGPVPYDGVVGRITELGARRAQKNDVPIVNVWQSTSAKGLPGVFPDQHASGTLVAEHLVSRGFHNLAVLIHDHDEGAKGQAAGLEQFAKAAGLNGWFGRLCLHDETNHTEWRRSVQAIKLWMKDWELPLGMLIREPLHARLIIELARERGWHVPDQIAIVCSYNNESQCVRPEPSLTAVEVPFAQCGYEAASMLDRLIEAKRQGKSPFAEQETVLLPPVGVVARQSTDFFAVADPLVRQALRYIAQNLSKPLDVENVARDVGVSRRTLDTRFQARLGKTMASEILRLRIERVKRELATGGISIERIAKNAGFGSPRTLNEQFLRCVGVTPREFRKQATLRAADLNLLSEE